MMEIIQLESANSTNTILMDMSKKSAKSWTAVWTTNQMAGRGYSGNSWISEKGKNLAISVLIKCELNYEGLIYFNQWVANVVAKVLNLYANEVYVKWPNDIIVKGKKVCGILIETHKLENELNIVVGVGLNVNQTNFEGFPKAASLATQTTKEFDLTEILSALLSELEKSFHLIENHDWDGISKAYNSQLFGLNQICQFKKDGIPFDGIIKETDAFGRLVVEVDGETQYFIHKEIEMVY